MKRDAAREMKYFSNRIRNRFSLSHIVSFIIWIHVTPPKQREEKRQKNDLSFVNTYNVNKNMLMFRISIGKIFHFYRKSSLRSLPTTASFHYNIGNKFWFIDIILYVRISDSSVNYLPFNAKKHEMYSNCSGA